MGLIDEIKTVAKTAQDVGNIETYAKLLDVQREALELLEQNQTLRQCVQELEAPLEHRSSLELRGGRYYYAPDPNLGPVCPKCYNDSGIVVELTTTTGGPWCDHCRSGYSRTTG